MVHLGLRIGPDAWWLRFGSSTTPRRSERPWWLLSILYPWSKFENYKWSFNLFRNQILKSQFSLTILTLNSIITTYSISWPIVSRSNLATPRTNTTLMGTEAWGLSRRSTPWRHIEERWRNSTSNTSMSCKKQPSILDISMRDGTRNQMKLR